MILLYTLATTEIKSMLSGTKIPNKGRKKM